MQTCGTFPVGECSREKRTITPLDEHVKDRRFERWVCRVTV
jgi:hypothetical protein